jgi:hypothetical protein
VAELDLTLTEALERRWGVKELLCARQAVDGVSAVASFRQAKSLRTERTGSRHVPRVLSESRCREKNGQRESHRTHQGILTPDGHVMQVC